MNSEKLFHIFMDRIHYVYIKNAKQELLSKIGDIVKLDMNDVEVVVGNKYLNLTIIRNRLPDVDGNVIFDQNNFKISVECIHSSFSYDSTLWEKSFVIGKEHIGVFEEKLVGALKVCVEEEYEDYLEKQKQNWVENRLKELYAAN